ncbi:hypothetical protein AB3R30_23915 [Leptolyngbyaceae cyanobacterium UHCC 1019]
MTECSMPGGDRYTLDLLLQEVQEVYQLGNRAIALFPLIPYDQEDRGVLYSIRPFIRLV